MVGESLTTRSARERLAAIKKFIPVRDRVRERLQQRQQAQTDFSVSSEELFAPITSATKDVKTLTEAAIYGDIPERERAKKAPLLDTLEQIAAETGQTRAVIQQLSSDIKTQREFDIDDSAPPGDIEELEEEPQGATAKGEEQDQPQGGVEKWTTPENTLTPHSLAEIRKITDEQTLIDLLLGGLTRK